MVPQALQRRARRLTRRVTISGLKLWTATIPQSPSVFADAAHPPRALLVQNLSGIGNALMATPLLAELRRLYPDARIDFLTTPATAQLLAGNPHATSVIADPHTVGSKQNTYWPLIRRLREARYDACFVTITAVDFTFAVRPVLARIPIRVIHDYGFHGFNRFTKLFTHRVPFDQVRHDVESNLDLLRALTASPVKAVGLVLSVSKVEVEAAKRRLAEAGWRDEGQTVAFCPGSTLRWSEKRWPNEHYLALANELLAGPRDTQLLIFCGPDEADDARFFREKLAGRRATVIEGMALPTYAAAIALCDVVVTGDSLPMHMAAALQVPSVALFGPTDPRRTGPWMCPTKVIVPDCDWIPYYRMPYPPDPRQFKPSMPLIPVAEVYAAVEDIIGSTRPQETVVPPQ